MREPIADISKKVKESFETTKRIISFEEYLRILLDSAEQQLRGSAKYMVDMFEDSGMTPLSRVAEDKLSPKIFRFNLFDQPIDGIAMKVVGHEEVQASIYHAMKVFIRQGISNKLILLHGPNGSAKSTIVAAMMSSLERYSTEKKGALYTFSWVFPHESNTKGKIGINKAYSDLNHLESYANLPDDDLAARFPCDMKDHPLLLVPATERRGFMNDLVGKERADRIWKSLPHYLINGSLCHRCNEIYESLISKYHGDYKNVLKHIQVERFFFSKRYRKGLVTIEPQLHVDAQYQLLTVNKNISALPTSLQSMNFFSLGGDLIDGNRGLLEFSDLLKRPVDSFKYLLTACEAGRVNVGSAIAYLDQVMIGSSNELQMDAFKEFPDFSSFKARMELVRVPYLLRVSEEDEIYQSVIEASATEKHVAPHVSPMIALWSVLTRLKKPNSINYPPEVSSLIASLTPLDKAKLYDRGEVPPHFGPEERKLLRSNLKRLREEYTGIPYYEGRMGASVREVKSILFEAAQNQEFACLSPASLFKTLEEFVKRVSEYDFLKQDIKEGYHDSAEFIKTIRQEYLNRIDHEVREAMELYDPKQWEDFLKRYIEQVSLVLKKEKGRNPITGKNEDPDQSLISEFEKIVAAPKGEKELTSFRQAAIAQIGAWSLDHPKEELIYSKVFPHLWQKLEKHYYESQKSKLTKMRNSLNVYGTDEFDPNSEGSVLAQRTIENLKSNHPYCDHCAKEAITYLLQARY